MLQFGQLLTCPHSLHCMNAENPRRFSRRMLCSPRAILCANAASSGSLMTLLYVSCCCVTASRTSLFFLRRRLTTSTLGSCPPPTRCGSDNILYFPASALIQLSRDG